MQDIQINFAFFPSGTVTEKRPLLLAIEKAIVILSVCNKLTEAISRGLSVELFITLPLKVCEYNVNGATIPNKVNSSFFILIF